MLMIPRAKLNGSQTKMFIRGDSPTKDSSPSDRTITNTGSVTSVTPSGSPPAGFAKALSYNGSSQYLTSAQSTDFDLGASDFTVDVWAYPTATAAGSAIYTRNSSGVGLDARLVLFHQSGGNWLAWASSDGSSWDVLNGSSFGSVSLNTWQHLAITRRGGTAYLFKGGVLSTSLAAGGIGAVSASVSIGLYAGAYCAGQIIALRITKGIARWTKNFTPPARY